MKNFYQIVVVLLMVLGTMVTNVTAQSTKKPGRNASKVEIAKYYGQSTLKGTTALSTLPGRFCSTDDPVDIYVDELHDDRTDIVWTVYTGAVVTGTYEEHNDWVTPIGASPNNGISFNPAVVPATYYGVNIKIAYEQVGTDGSKDGIDVTVVNKTPTAYDFTQIAEICENKSTTITLPQTDDGTYYNLYRGITLINQDGAIKGDGGPINFFVDSAGAYTVRGFDNNTEASSKCFTWMTGAADVTVHPEPQLSVTSTMGTTFCEGTTTTLSASETSTPSMDPDVEYVWRVGGSTVHTGASFDVTPTTSTSYEVTGTNINTGCDNKSTIDIVVNPKPEVAPKYEAVCEGQDLKLHADPSGGSGTYNTFAWSGPNSFTSSVQDPVRAAVTIGTDDGTYRVTVTDDNNCTSDEVTVDVTITGIPTPTINGSQLVTTTTICDQGSISLTGGGGTSYTWTLPDLSTQNGSTLNIDPASKATHEGVYKLTVSDGTCPNTLDHNVVINSLPAVTANNNGPVCEGDDITLTGEPAGMTSYSWSGPGFTNGAQNPPAITNATIANQGNYTLTVIDGNSCENSAVTNVVVNLKPTALPTQDAVCSGTDLKLHTNPSGGTGPYSNFVWTGVNSFSSNIEDPTRSNVTLADQGNYFVTFEDANGCESDQANVNVTISESPTVAVVYNSPVCINKSLVLTALPSGGSGIYNSYSWTFEGNPIPGETSSTLTIDPVDATDAGLYGVTVNDNSGCSSAETTINVSINQLPDADAGLDQELCEGDPLLLTGGASGGTPNYEYNWTGPNNYEALNTQNPDLGNADLSEEGTFILTVRDANGCEDTEEVEITINEITATLNITNPSPPGTSVCTGTEVTYSAAGTGGTGDYNYEFFVGGVSQGAPSATSTIIVTINNDVTVEVEVTDNVTGCDDRTSINMTAKAIPNVSLDQPKNGQEFCENALLTLVAKPSGYNNYVYYKTDGTTDTQLNTLGTETHEVTGGFDTSITGVYVVSTENGCSAQSATINITINPLPTADAGKDQSICEEDPLILDGSASGGTPGYDYSWSSVGGYSSTAEDPDLGTAELSEADTYTLTVTDSKNCQNTNDVVISIDPLPQDQTVAADNTEYCQTSTGVRIYLHNSENGVRYQLQDAGNNPVGTDVVADGVSTVEWTNVTAGTYHVVAFGSTANACSITLSTAPITVTENSLPNIHRIVPDDVDNGCNAGAGWPIGLNGSDNGIEYQLLRNGIPYGAPVPGDGGAITLNKNVTAFGLYTIRAINTTTSCDVMMEEDYEIQSDVVITVYDMTSTPGSGDYCVSDASPGVTMGMTGSDATVEYQLILNGNNAAPEQTHIGDGNPINFVNKVTIDGVYTVQVETPGGCSFPMNGSITVTAHNDPATFNVQADNNGFYCPDPAGSPTGVNIWITGQENGIDYTLYRDNAGSPIAIETVTGTVDDPLAQLNFAGGPYTIEDTYYVEAQVPGVGCRSAMNNTIAVTENPLLQGFNITKADDFCENSSVSIFVDGSESDAEYRWVANDGSSDVANSAWVAGTGSQLEFTGINIEGTYRIEAQRTENGITCSREMLNTVDIVEKPLPLDKIWSTTGGSGCDDGVVITIENSELGVTYYLWKRGTPDVEVTGAEIIGDGNDIQFAPISDKAALYNIVADLNGCQNDFDINISVDVTGAINKLTVEGGGSVCSGGIVGAVVGMTDATVVGVTYELFLADSPGAITGTSKGIIDGDGTVRNFGNQTDLGEYYVIGTNTSDGSCPTEMTNRVTISYYTDPTAGIIADPGNTICENREVTFTGSGGSNYQFYINGNPIGAGFSPVSTYTNSALSNGDRVSVMVESADGCTAQSADIVMTVNPMPIAKNVGTTGSFCQGTASNVSVYVEDPEAGFTYTLIDVSDDSTVDTDNTLPILFNNIAEGTYKVEAAANGCSIEMNNTVTIAASPLPTVFDIDPTVSVTSCVDNSIKLSNSETGVAYTLLRDGNIVGGPTDGSHNGIEVPFGDYKVTGTYRITAENLTTGCTADMNGTFAISAGTGNAYDVTPADGSYCTSLSRPNIGLSNSDNGIKYILYRNNGTGNIMVTEVTSSSDGEVIDFGVTTEDGTYTVVGEDAGGCQFSMSNSVIIQEVAAPTSFALEAGNGLTTEQYCPGDPGISAIHVKGQQLNVTYTLYDQNDNVIGIPIVGTVDDANVDIVFSGPFAAEVYHVVASNSSGCSANMSNTVTVAESPALRDDFEVIATGDICSGYSAEITTDGSENNVRYWLYRNGLTTGNYIDGNGGALDPPFTVNQGGTYTLEAINTTGCRAFLVDNEIITETNLPTVKAIVSDGGTDCGTGAVITVQLADPNITYQLYKRTGSGDVLVNGSAISHSGGVPTDISFAGIIDRDAYYTVKASNGSCEVDMSNNPGVDVDPNNNDDVYVNIIDAPVKYEVGPTDASICNGDLGTVFYLEDSEAGVTYSLFVRTVAGTTQLVDTVSPGGYIEFEGVHNVPGEYYVEADNSTCVTTMINEPVLNVNPLPTAYKMIGSGFYCDVADGAEIKLENQEANVRYYLQFQDGLEEGNVLGGGAGDTISFGKFTKEGIYKIVAYNQNTTCTSNMEGTVEVILTSAPQDQILDPTIVTTYCSAVAGVELKLTNNELDVTYQVRDEGNNVISEVVGTNNDVATPEEIKFPDLISEGTYTIWKTRGSDACESITNNGNTIEISSEGEPTGHNVVVDNNRVCGSVGATVTLEDSETGRSYRIEADGIAVNDTITSIAGEPINWSVNETVAGPVIYDVIAIAGTVCDKSMGSIEVMFSESPSAFDVFTELDSNVGVLEYCEGSDSISVGIVSTQVDVGYMLIDNATGSTVDFISGSGNKEYYNNKYGIGSYSVRAVLFSTGCPLTTTVPIDIVKLDLPESSYMLSCTTPDIDDCYVGDYVTMDGSEIGIEYSLFKGKVAISPIGNVKVGDGNGVTFNDEEILEGGMYHVMASNPVTGCNVWIEEGINFFDSPLIARNDSVSIYKNAQAGGIFVGINDVFNAVVDNQGTGLEDLGNIRYEILDGFVNETGEDIVNDEGELIKSIGITKIDSITGSLIYEKLPRFFGLDSVRYSVQNIDKPYRQDEAIVYIYVGNKELDESKTFLIPNAFSPNGDDKNDKFKITGINKNGVTAEKSSLEVFNRWGTLVYRSKGTTYGEDDEWWDGTSSTSNMVTIGSDLPNGTYYYIFKVDANIPYFDIESGETTNRIESKEYNGYVELRR